MEITLGGVPAYMEGRWFIRSGEAGPGVAFNFGGE